VFRDMRELWTLPFDGARLLAAKEAGESGRRPQFSVMLLDCGRLDWKVEDIVARLDAGTLTYEQLMYDMVLAPDYRAGIEPQWNSLEQFDAAETRLVHYTDMGTQPWVSTANPLGHLWMTDLLDAINAGFLSRDYVADHVARGYVRPSLLFQIDQRRVDSAGLPGDVRRRDDAFRAPFQEILQRRGLTWGPRSLARATLRRLYRRSGLPRWHQAVRARLLR
jgi:hypothetical protein